MADVREGGARECDVSSASLATAILTFTVAIGCARPAAEMPRGPASIAGRVTSVDPAGERIGVIRVEARPEDAAGSPKAVVRVEQGTAILTADAARVEFRTLRTGQWVRVWFAGPVRESYPVQAQAATIVIDSASSSQSSP